MLCMAHCPTTRRDMQRSILHVPARALAFLPAGISLLTRLLLRCALCPMRARCLLVLLGAVAFFAHLASAQVCFSGVPCNEMVGCTYPGLCNAGSGCNSYVYGGAYATQKCLGRCVDQTQCGCRKDLNVLPCSTDQTTTSPMVCFNQTTPYASDSECPPKGQPCLGYYSSFYNYTCPNGQCSWGLAGCKSEPVSCPVDTPYCWQEELCLPIEMKGQCGNTAQWCDNPDFQFCTSPKRCAPNATACCNDPALGAFRLSQACPLP